MESPTVQKNKTECKMTLRNEEPHVNKRFPRVRGDVPIIWWRAIIHHGFSPRARGCSHHRPRKRGKQRVFPACAGMFLTCDYIAHTIYGFPRVRGDVPFCVRNNHQPRQFSPRARGCSISGHFHNFHIEVFPACAGMFPL